MRISPPVFCAAVCVGLLPGTAAVRLRAQTFPAIAAPVAGNNFPQHVPSALPAHHRKTDAPLIYARIRDGVFSIDGLVGKVRLNYDVKAASYFYLFMPGVGTALVSLAPSVDTLSVPATYKDSQLTIKIADHTFNLTGVESLVDDRGKEPGKLYVSLDRSAWRLSRAPMVGYGTTVVAPYQWPGSLPATAVAAEAPEPGTAPGPVPAALLPKPIGTGEQAGAAQ